jgi:hypothetical protein
MRRGASLREGKAQRSRTDSRGAGITALGGRPHTPSGVSPGGSLRSKADKRGALPAWSYSGSSRPVPGDGVGGRRPVTPRPSNTISRACPAHAVDLCTHCFACMRRMSSSWGGPRVRIRLPPAGSPLRNWRQHPATIQRSSTCRSCQRIKSSTEGDRGSGSPFQLAAKFGVGRDGGMPKAILISLTSKERRTRPHMR